MPDAAEAALPAATAHSRTSPRALLPLTLTALGVVYGDIGTSPLYALRECFFGTASGAADARERPRRAVARSSTRS